MVPLEYFLMNHQKKGGMKKISHNYEEKLYLKRYTTNLHAMQCFEDSCGLLDICIFILETLK